jgi:Outer membrane efflux protein
MCPRICRKSVSVKRLSANCSMKYRACRIRRPPVVRIKRAEFIPDLDLVFRYAHPATNDRLPQNIALAGVSLTWEIFDWGRKSREAAERERAAEQAKTTAAETR